VENFAPAAHLIWLLVTVNSCLSLVQTIKQASPYSLIFQSVTFGKTKIVRRAFQAQWFGKWRWLHYDCSWDLAFCHTCISAFRTGKLKLSSGIVKDSAFLFAGFSNWKDATVAFMTHEKSATHKRAVESVITIPQTTRDVGELLSSVHAAEKCTNQQCLVTIAENVRFLARKGIALRGDVDEDNSNFTQLLYLRAVVQPQLLTWLKRKTDQSTGSETNFSQLWVALSLELLARLSRKFTTSLLWPTKSRILRIRNRSSFV